METLGKRILRRRKQLHLTQVELAQKLKGITHTAVSYWESDKAIPNSTNLYELSVLLNCSVSWLLNGVDDIELNTDIEHKQVIANISKIPIVNERQIISQDFENINDFILNNRENISKKSFAYKITNNSMFPVFGLGDMVIIDPEMLPETDYFVLAKVANGVIFRKLIITGFAMNNVAQFILLPQNNDYPTFSSDKNKIEILGVMVEHRIYQLRR